MGKLDALFSAQVKTAALTGAALFGSLTTTAQTTGGGEPLSRRDAKRQAKEIIRNAKNKQIVADAENKAEVIQNRAELESEIKSGETRSGVGDRVISGLARFGGDLLEGSLSDGQITLPGGRVINLNPNLARSASNGAGNLGDKVGDDFDRRAQNKEYQRAQQGQAGVNNGINTAQTKNQIANQERWNNANNAMADANSQAQDNRALQEMRRAQILDLIEDYRQAGSATPVSDAHEEFYAALLAKTARNNGGVPVDIDRASYEQMTGFTDFGEPFDDVRKNGWNKFMRDQKRYLDAQAKADLKSGTNVDVYKPNDKGEFVEQSKTSGSQEKAPAAKPSIESMTFNEIQDLREKFVEYGKAATAQAVKGVQAQSQITQMTPAQLEKETTNAKGDALLSTVAAAFRKVRDTHDRAPTVQELGNMLDMDFVKNLSPEGQKLLMQRVEQQDVRHAPGLGGIDTSAREAMEAARAAGASLLPDDGNAQFAPKRFTAMLEAQKKHGQNKSGGHSV